MTKLGLGFLAVAGAAIALALPALADGPAGNDVEKRIQIAAQDPPPAQATGKEVEAKDPTDEEKKKAAESLEKSKKGEKKDVEGKWQLDDGTPTYNVVRDGEAVKKVDWYTYSGWRRYHAECHVCHGPNAEGSSFAPALADSLKSMTYEKFLAVVSSGQRREVGGTQFIMPALGDNKNVMCYIDDLYIYIKARASGELPGGRLSADQRDEKPKPAKEYEESCLGS